MASDLHSISNKLRRAYQAIAAEHKLQPIDGEVFADQQAGILRIQDYAFTQGFAVVKTHEDKGLRKMVTLECTRHGKQTRNTRGLTEAERKRHATHTQFLECPYKVKLRYRIKTSDWRLNMTTNEHNHALLDDPFQLVEHRCRDPDRAAACVEGAALRATHQPYSAARRILRVKGLRLDQKEYYNLASYSKARTPAQEVQYALRTLETRGFHVRVKEKYLVDQDVRHTQEIQFFFFCNKDQVMMARRFASQFLVITDATFTTNANEMPLSVIVCVTNLLRSFPIAYCFIASESADAFVFINECMRELFFHDSCRGPAVILGDFAAGLTAAMVAKRRLSANEVGMEVAYELAAQLDEAGSDLFLQLCSWHAAEAIKQRLIREGYPMDVRKDLVDKIWEWIKSPTLEDLATNRQKLIDDLRAKDQDYIASFYEPKEPQFVKAYTRLRPNLGCYSSQRSEGLHPVIKGVCNRHTPIGQSIDKITEQIEELVISHEHEIEKQKRNLPRSIDNSRKAFEKISPHITHEAINLILREWNKAKRWYEDCLDGKEDAPEGSCCHKGCDLPLQYGLPCACWMFDCIPFDFPIPLSLIHPRWLFKAPDLVVGWKMSVDPSIGIKDYHNLTVEQDENDSDSGDSDGEFGARSQKMAPGTAPGASLRGVTPGASHPPPHLGDRFERSGATLIEENALTAYDYHKQIPDAAKKELYAKELAKTMKSFNTKFHQKFIEQPLPRIFPNGGIEKDLKYKKGGSRRRAYTGREAAEAEETEARRRCRRASNEAKKTARHEEILKRDEEAIFACTQDYIAGDIDIPTDDDDSDIEFLGGNDIQGPHQQVPEDFPPSTGLDKKGKARALSFSSSSSSSSSSGIFRDIDELLADAEPAKKPPAPLISLSQVKSESQLPSQLRAPTSSAATATRGARGVERKKTKAQKEKESQDRHRMEEKVRRKDKAAERKVKREEKKLLPRKDDVSQLAASLLSSSI